MQKSRLFNILQTSLARPQVAGVVQEYQSLHAAGPELRKANYAKLAHDYYDLATDFYEFGWGESFHFAPRRKGESLQESIQRLEQDIAQLLDLRPGMHVLDVGCGVGGPMRNIARYSGATMIGINNNGYQLKRGTKHNETSGLTNLCSFIEADFMHIPVPDECYEAVYTIDAACYAPDKTKLFREILRVMRDGSYFAGSDWCLTPKYQADRPEHREIKKGIEEGTGLPDIWYEHDVVDSLKAAGFEVIASRDLASTSDAETPWWLPLSRNWSISGLKHSAPGRWLTNTAVRLLESTRVLPQGATEVSTFLNAGADALVRAGASGIFTPMFFFHARKPG